MVVIQRVVYYEQKDQYQTITSNSANDERNFRFRNEFKEIDIFSDLEMSLRK